MAFFRKKKELSEPYKTVFDREVLNLEQSADILVAICAEMGGEKITLLCESFVAVIAKRTPAAEKEYWEK